MQTSVQPSQQQPRDAAPLHVAALRYGATLLLMLCLAFVAGLLSACGGGGSSAPAAAAAPAPASAPASAPGVPAAPAISVAIVGDEDVQAQAVELTAQQPTWPVVLIASQGASLQGFIASGGVASTAAMAVDVVVLSLGRNDAAAGLYTPTAFASALGSVITSMRSAGHAVVVETPRPGVDFGLFAAAVRTMVAGLPPGAPPVVLCDRAAVLAADPGTTSTALAARLGVCIAAAQGAAQ